MQRHCIQLLHTSIHTTTTITVSTIWTNICSLTLKLDCVSYILSTSGQNWSRIPWKHSTVDENVCPHHTSIIMSRVGITREHWFTWLSLSSHFNDTWQHVSATCTVCLHHNYTHFSPLHRHSINNIDNIKVYTETVQYTASHNREEFTTAALPVPSYLHPFHPLLHWNQMLDTDKIIWADAR